MVQVLPSAADVLAQPLEEFTKGLDKLLAPNFEFQKAMQKAIGANPELAQSLADLEYNAPGTLNRMGFGHLGNVISQIPESPQSKVARQKRGTIADTLGKKAELENAQTGFDLTRLNKLFEVIHSKPGEALLTDDVYRILTGQTEAQHEIETGKAEVAAAKKPLEIGQARTAYDQFIKQKPGLANIDFLNVARDFLSGRADGKTISDIMSGNTPGAGEAFNAALKSVEEERQLAMRERLEGMRESSLESRAEAREGAAEDKAKRREAVQAWMRSGMVSSPQAWETLLNEPEKLTAVQEKKAKGGELTQDEKDLFAAGNVQQAINDREKVKRVRGNIADIQKTLTSLTNARRRGAPESEMQIYLENLNNALKEKEDLTGQHIEARYGPPPEVGETTAPGHTLGHPFSGPPPQVYFVGKDGKRVPDSEYAREPKTGISSLSANGQRAYMEIEGAADKQAALEQLKKVNIALYNEVAPLYNRK